MYILRHKKINSYLSHTKQGTLSPHAQKQGTHASGRTHTRKQEGKAYKVIGKQGVGGNSKPKKKYRTNFKYTQF